MVEVLIRSSVVRKYIVVFEPEAMPINALKRVCIYEISATKVIGKSAQMEFFCNSCIQFCFRFKNEPSVMIDLEQLWLSLRLIEKKTCKKIAENESDDS